MLDAIATLFTGGVNAMLQAENNSNQNALGYDTLDMQKRTNQQNFQLAQNIANNNYDQQVAKLEWDKQAQQTTWNREDSAVQRRAADLQAAGLSKTLAAGGAAQTSAPVHIEAPQMPMVQKDVIRQSDVPQLKGFQLPDLSAIARGVMMQNAQIAQSQAQIKLTEQQAQRVEEERKGLAIENLVKADKNKMQMQGMALQNTLLGASVDQISLDKQIKKLNISQKEIDNRIDQVKATVAEKFGLSSAQVEIIAKQQALANAQMDWNVKNYNLKSSQDLGLRTTDGLDPVSRMAQGVSGTLSKSASQIVDEIKARARAKGGK